MNNSAYESGGRKISRRHFVEQVAMGAAAVSIAGMTSIPAVRPEEKLGIALVGLGYYSTDLLAPALQETEHAYLAGIVTGTPEKAEAWSKQYNIPAANIYNYENFDSIADNPAIDIVYVVLPNSMHAEYTIRAARAGKHVICEKPMALSVRECEQMIEACEQAGKKLSIGYRLHFEPTTQEVMRIAREKPFGHIQFVTAGAGYRESRAGHWKISKEYGGGAMMDMGVYSLQGARYSTGEEPIAVTAQAFNTRPDLIRDVDETTTFQLEFPSGAVANCHTSFATNMNYLLVNAERGWVRLQPFSGYGGIKGETSEGVLSYPQINQQAAQMDEVARCIKEELPMRVPGEEGLKDMRVVEAIYRSIREGARISLT